MGLIPVRRVPQPGCTPKPAFRLNARDSRGRSQDILYDPQTSGGLLIALPEKDAAQCLDELRQSVPQAAAVGYVTEKMDAAIYLE